VTGGKIECRSPIAGADPDLSHLTVLVNGEVGGSIPLRRKNRPVRPPPLAINPVLFQEDNRLLFRFIGHYTSVAKIRAFEPVLVLSNTSALTLQFGKIWRYRTTCAVAKPFYDQKTCRGSNCVVFSARTRRRHYRRPHRGVMFRRIGSV